MPYGGLGPGAVWGMLRDEAKNKKAALGIIDQIEAERQSFQPTPELGQFDLMERARQLGLTSKYSQLPEVQSYLSEPMKTKAGQQTLDLGDVNLANQKRDQKRFDEAGAAIDDVLSLNDLAKTLGDKSFNLKDEAFQSLSPYADDKRVESVFSNIHRDDNNQFKDDYMKTQTDFLNWKMNNMPTKDEKLADANKKADNKKGADVFNRETTLRKEYNALSKDYSTIRDSYSRVLSSSKEPTAAGDLSLIFNYMKMLDPNSVVRESEYASAENARGVPESIRNVFNKVKDGLILSPAQRKDFITRAKGIYSTAEGIQKKQAEQYNKIAGMYNISPANVTGSIVVGAETDEKEPTMQPSATKYLEEIRARRAARGPK